MSEATKEQQQPATAEEQRIEAIARPILAAHGVDLFELTLRRERSGWVLRVVLDVLDTPGHAPSVTLEQCADVSRDLSDALDAADPLEQEYTLEVSSPGVERPLRALRDYVRFDGKLARLWIGGPKSSVLQARLRGVRDQQVLIETEGGESREVGFAEIKRAHLVFESPAQPKGKTRNPKRHPTR